MRSFQRVRERLPTLYRPEDGDRSLLTRVLEAVGAALDGLEREANDVLLAHWYSSADRALYEPYAVRLRDLRDEPVPAPGDSSVLTFPYVHDLARLAALLALPPVQEPLALRELVEPYRLRIRRIVDLYRNGLGTRSALKGMVEASLPLPDPTAPAELRDRPFWVHESVPAVRRSHQVRARGEPADMVGPLMRWSLSNASSRPISPTVYIQGVAPVAREIDATTSPLIELYRAPAEGERVRAGFGYDGTIAPGQTLRLRPAHSSWLGGPGGLQRADSWPTAGGAVDPTAPGPWQAAVGAPSAPVSALVQTRDRCLWVAAGNGDGGTLWRYDGASWLQAIDGAQAILCLAEDGNDLLVGTDLSLWRMPLYPSGSAYAVSQVLAGQAVYALLGNGDGSWWLGTDKGIVALRADGTTEPFGLRPDRDTDVPVYSIGRDLTGSLYFGTELGLFQHQPGTGHWYWYAGEKHTEQAGDWEKLSPDHPDIESRNVPASEDVFLPPVHRVLRSRDASLWMGTARGIARYVARAVRGTSYETVLEAFPDLSGGRVFDIAEDARGILWFATDRGLLRYDGRDWWQHLGGTWVRLGRGDILAGNEPRGTWRFDRASGRWQRLRDEAWLPFTESPRTQAAPAVHAFAWTDAVAADLGTWDGASFAVDAGSPVDTADLRMRFKPAEDRTVAGGIPAVPRLPVGDSVWRYLALEPADVTEPAGRPSWTQEGRLLPPPGDLPGPGEGRHDVEAPAPPSEMDEAVFAFNPAARVWFTWEESPSLTVLVRLKWVAGEEHVEPAVLDRVWQGMEQVRPAGIKVMLGVEETIVRGSEEP